MNTDNRKSLIINNLSLNIIKKDIKNLHVSVLPPDGKVRITAPTNMNEEAIRMALVSRLSWIKKQQEKFLNQDRQSAREYVSGESHYYLGKQYRLKVVIANTSPKIFIKGKNQIILQVNPETTKIQRERIVVDWYRKQLHEIADKLAVKREKAMGVKIDKLVIRRMKTRWGSCSKQTKKVCLNLELIKKPAVCIEYVLVHEICHIFEKKHNQHFIDLMDQHMPKWRIYKEELNRFPLAYEKWSY